MINTGDLRKGIVIELDDELYNVLDYRHINIGRGSAQVRLRLKSLRAGHIIERTFQASERFSLVRLDRRSAQFLYRDDDLHYFMDTDTFDQIPLNLELLGDAVNYLKENLVVEILTHEDSPIGIDIPLSVELEIAETGPSHKGDTAQGGTKPAVLETGLMVQVPLFLNTGDTIRVNTSSGDYIERVQ